MSTLCPDICTDNLVQDSLVHFIQKHLSTYAPDQSLSRDDFHGLWQALATYGLHAIGHQYQAENRAIPHALQWTLLRILSRYSPGLALSYLAHNILVAHPLSQYAHTTWHHETLSKLLAGSLACCAISEPGAGSDVMAITTTAQSTEDGYIIQGKKSWITNAPYADYMLVYAKVDNKQGRDLAVFLLPSSLDGITCSEPLRKIGMHPSPTGLIMLDNVKVPAYCRVDSAMHSGKKILFSQLDYERLMLSAGPVGIMDWCLSTTKDYLDTREQFGQKLSSFQLMQAHIADIFTAREASAAFAQSLFSSVAQETLSTHHAAAAYLFCSEQCLMATDRTIQCLGGMGYMHESLAGKYHQDAKLFTIGGGTSEIKRWLIGRRLLG